MYHRNRSESTVAFAILAIAVLALAVAAYAVTQLIKDDSDDARADPADAITEAITGDVEQTCAERFAPGRPTADVVAENEAGPCLDGDEVVFAVDTSWECPDGTAIHQAGDYGWGRDGGTWQGPEVPAPDLGCAGA